MTETCLATWPLPAATSSRARDLTRREALEVVVYLIGQGEFRLKAWTPLRFGPACRLVTPTPATRLAIEPAVIAGVRLVNRLNPRADFVFNLDVRLVVGLHRLATMLRSTWGVTELHHLGIGQGRGGSRDCHNTGRAVDFAGVAGVNNNTPYTLDVLNDWGRQPVTMPDGSVRGDWPVSFRDTTYRLATSANTLARDVFADVYALAAREFADTSTRRFGNGPPTTIGRSSNFILHPDYPVGARWGRPAHRNHVHFQIGPTGAEASPP
jgi:hypothetical protein